MIPLVEPCYSSDDLKKFGAYFDYANQVRAFEEEFAEYVGCAGGVAVNSGTNALLTVLRVLGGRTAGLPSFGCRALLDAVRMAGYEPWLYDNLCFIDAAFFEMDSPFDPDPLPDVEVLPHMFGSFSWYEEERGWNGKVGVAVVDDITLSLGAGSYHEGHPWTVVCSFNRDKMISTGRGGMIASRDVAFLERCRELAYYDQPRNGAYQPAFSFGMTGMQAALGRSQLRQLPGFIERRREIASRYTAAFSEVGIETPDPDVNSVFFRYIVGVDDPAACVRRLADHGVEAGRGVNPLLHRLLGLDPAGFPGAEKCFSRLLSVPVHPGLTDEQVQFILVQVLETCAP